MNKRRRYIAKRRRRVTQRIQRLQMILGSRAFTWAERNEYCALYGNRGY